MGSAQVKEQRDVATDGQPSQIPDLHDHLMREIRNRDPLKYYQVEAVLGVGSMGSVAKVTKKDTARGGSARPSFVKSHSHPFTPPQLSCCWGGSEAVKPGLISPDSSFHSSPSHGRHSSLSSIITYNHKVAYHAMKSIHLDRAANEAFVDELRNEVAILRTLDHPNIVRPLETYYYKRQLYIIMELCAGGDLYTRDPYTEKEAARITSSVLSAVAYMHSRNITHRDLKYENIMFTSTRKDADVKLIDFGLSTKYGNTELLHDAVGTVYSMSPEVLRGEYTSKVDVWSMGVLSFMLLSSSMPFYGRSRKHVIQRITKGSVKFKGRTWNYISDDAKKFVLKLLEYEPDKRPTAEEAMQLPWLKKEFESDSPELEKMDIVQATLQRFAQYGTLKKLALLVVAHKSTYDEIGFLRKIFKKYDVSNDGEITLADFKDALEEYDYSDEEIETMFRGMDIDRTGFVHYSEFLAATIEAHGAIDEERLAEAFDRLDGNDSGYITVKNLADMLGGSVSKSYLDAIIDEADLTHDHKICYDEFLALWDEEDDEKRVQALQQVEQRRKKNPSVTSTSSVSSLEKTCEIDDLISDISASDDEAVTGDFLFRQEKAKSVRGVVI